MPNADAAAADDSVASRVREAAKRAALRALFRSRAAPRRHTDVTVTTGNCSRRVCAATSHRCQRAGRWVPMLLSHAVGVRVGAEHQGAHGRHKLGA